MGVFLFIGLALAKEVTTRTRCGIQVFLNIVVLTILNLIRLYQQKIFLRLFKTQRFSTYSIVSFCHANNLYDYG